MENSQKIKNKTPWDPAIPISGYLSEEYENANSKRYVHSYVHCRIIYKSQDMVNKWIKKDMGGVDNGTQL